MKLLWSLLIVAVVASLAMAVVGRGSEPAQACTGGVSPLERVVPDAEMIFLGEVIEVGGPVNAAPTVTPTQTPTATTTVIPGMPTFPPAARPEPIDYDLTGYGATLRVVEAYAGVTGDVVALDAGARMGIEQELRNLEAGVGVSLCGVAAFVPRYELGGRYLVFAGTVGDLPYGFAVFRVRDGDITFDDPRLLAANNGVLIMEPATYRRYFGAFQAQEYGDGNGPLYIMSGRVPVTAVLSAVAALRGDPSIAPPSTGSAGLAAGR